MAAGQLQEGTLINGRYRIKKALGQGGMGTVYMAEHERLDTVVAVKEVRGERTDTPEYRSALSQCEQEARFLVRLNHPNLPKVTDAFIENDRFYLVMEYVQGVTLESRLHDADDKLPAVAQVVDWGLQVADVLAYLHTQEPPIIFRDLKPANIMVQPDGGVRLIDFGIARRFQPGANKDTALLGSVGYSPPEQFGQRQTDSRSDIYAFAATLHHLLTGVDPGQNPFKFTPAHLLNRAVPESLSRLLDQCLAFDADARPADIQEVALRLLAVRDDLALAPEPDRAGDSGSLAPLGGAASGQAARPPSARIPTSDTQKRRSGGHEPLSAPSGAASSGIAPARSRTGLLVGIGIAVLLLIAFPLTLLWGRFHAAKPTVKPRPSAGVIPTVTPTAPPATMPSVPAPNTNATPAPLDNSASITLENHNIVQDSQGAYWLWLRVGVGVTGKSGTPGTVAAFFYDAYGNPLPAADPNSIYADRDGEGQLYRSQSLTADSDTYTFTFDLYVPIAQFQSSQAASGVSVRGFLFLDGQQVGYTDRIALPEVIQALSYPPAGGTMQGGAERSRGRVGVGVNLGRQ